MSIMNPEPAYMLNLVLGNSVTRLTVKVEIHWIALVRVEIVRFVDVDSYSSS
jgi:hypothetical protein